MPDFGRGGVVDLKQGMGPVEPGFYFQSSAPVVARGRIIIGGFVPDNVQAHSPSGVIRAFDARTGELVWAWDMGDPSVTRDPPPGGHYTRGTPNMWSTPAYDDSLGLVYVPLGNETPDYFGMGRNPASERYSSSITALDIETGRPRWSVQTVHHDLWDYDVPSQPALVDLPDGQGGTVPALLQTTKRGQLFLLNRATGEAISRIVERPVPQNGAVPEERLSPTQPYSVDMPAIGAERLEERNAWGMTTLDQLWCRISFRQHRYDGEFTPIGLDPSLQYPGPLGGLNWGSVSVDPLNHIAFMNDLRMASSRTLVPRSEYAKWAARYPELGLHGHGAGLQRAGRHSVRRVRRNLGLAARRTLQPAAARHDQRGRSRIRQAAVAGAGRYHRTHRTVRHHDAYAHAGGHADIRRHFRHRRGPRLLRGHAGFLSARLRRAAPARSSGKPAAGRLERNTDELRVAEDGPSVRGGLGGRGCAVAQDRRLPDGFRAPGAQASESRGQGTAMRTLRDRVAPDHSRRDGVARWPRAAPGARRGARRERARAHPSKLPAEVRERVASTRLI